MQARDQADCSPLELHLQLLPYKPSGSCGLSHPSIPRCAAALPSAPHQSNHHCPLRAFPVGQRSPHSFNPERGTQSGHPLLFAAQWHPPTYDKRAVICQPARPRGGVESCQQEQQGAYSHQVRRTIYFYTICSRKETIILQVKRFKILTKKSV